MIDGHTTRSLEDLITLCVYFLARRLRGSRAGAVWEWGDGVEETRLEIGGGFPTFRNPPRGDIDGCGRLGRASNEVRGWTMWKEAQFWG